MKDNRMKHALENIAQRGVPEDINLMPHIAARLERKSFMTTLRTRPLMAVLLTLLILIAMTGVAYAIGRTFGYIPDVGLVENESGMRILEAPVSVMRDGVTLTVTQALVYPDHVQLVYEVSGIVPADNSATFSNEELMNSDEKAFCGPASSSRGGYLSDGDPFLRLPDGTMIDRVFEVDKYPENVFAMKPAYEVSLPADVMELTMVLKCIPWARLGAVPEDWEIRLKLTHVPAGTVVGQPVLEVTPSQSTSVSDKGIVVTLDKVVPQNDLHSFYITIAPDGLKSSPSILYPASASMLDSTGQKIALVDMQPFPGTHDYQEPWELQLVSRPAYGPYTLTLDRIFAYYNITPVTFEFDAGTNPQVGEVWEIGQTFHLDGGDVKVTSVKLVEKDWSIWGMSANTQGFEFTFESVDGTTPMLLDIMDFNLEHIMSRNIVPFAENGEPAVHSRITLYYGEGIPSGKIQVAINRQTTMLTGSWELQWTSPDQTGVTLLDPSSPVPSVPNDSGVSASLEKVVKLDGSYLFYIDMTAQEPRDHLRVIEPGSVFVIDSTGKKIALELNGPQVHAATHANIWEFSTTESIAEGSLQVVIENGTAHYNPWDVSVPPSQEMIAGQSFTFDAGMDPQLDQVWKLDHEFELGGYRGKVTSVRAVQVDSQQLPFPELRPDQTIDRGYEFTIQALEPDIKWNVSVSLDRPQDSTESFVDCIGYIPGEPASLTTHIVTCRGLFGQMLRVTIYEAAVQLDGIWKIDWNLPAQ